MGTPKNGIFVAPASLPAFLAEAGWKPALLPAKVNRRALIASAVGSERHADRKSEPEGSMIPSVAGMIVRVSWRV